MRLRRASEVRISNVERQLPLRDTNEVKKSSLLVRPALPFIALLIASACYGMLLRPSTANTKASIRKRLESIDEKQCSVYLAPSSLKGHVGFGIFTTRDIGKDESILSGPDGPSVPVVDYRGGPLRKLRKQWVRTWDNYWWARGVGDHVNYEAKNVIDYQFGFGALPNHHCILDALDHRYPTPPYDDSLAKRYESPGAGAFSYSMGREFYVTRDVRAGDELFLNYGYCQREGSSDSEDWSTTIPMVEDYHKAAMAAWESLKSGAEIQVPKDANKYVAALLHESVTELRAILATGKVENQNDFVPFVAKYLATTPRTPEWIRLNGMCLEHLTARKSRLLHAGQGAFVQHRIQKGEMVVPAPMIQIVDKDVLNMYDNNGSSLGSELLLNYCFGHHQSSMLLCPDTNALLINHCSNRKKQCGPKGPNVEYRWSTGWEPKLEEWLTKSIDEIAEELGRGLSMEIVALRDLEPGEEVFMDYGLEWENAWDAHVASWKPPVHDIKPFITAKDANEKEGPILEFLVTGDLRKVSDHPYLFTGCRFRLNNKTEQDEKWVNDPGWVDMNDEEILKRFAKNGSIFKGNYTTHSDRSHWPCSVLREEDNGSYTVRIHNRLGNTPPPKWEKNNLPRLLTNYPREGIHYFVQPYASDQNLPGVFRHPIGINDDIFPEKWKNRKQP